MAGVVDTGEVLFEYPSPPKKKTGLWFELYSLFLRHLCRIKSSLGGNHIPGMKQKYISTVIFTCKLENANRHMTKENAYIHFAVSLLNNKHGQNNLTCRVSDTKQSATVHRVKSSPPWLSSLSLSLTHTHTHTHTQPKSDDNKYGTPVASQYEIG
jgi:hypothetical protein